MGTRLEQATADQASPYHKADVPLRHFYSWIAVVCRIVGFNIVVVHHDAPAASLSMRYRIQHAFSLVNWTKRRSDAKELSQVAPDLFELVKKKGPDNLGEFGDGPVRQGTHETGPLAP